MRGVSSNPSDGGEHEVHDFDGSMLPCYRALRRGNGQAARFAQETALLAGQRAGERHDRDQQPDAGDVCDVAYQRAEAVRSLRLPVAIRRFNVSDDSDVELLADYYYRTRARAEADLRQFLRQLAGGGPFPGQLPVQGRLPAAKGNLQHRGNWLDRATPTCRRPVPRTPY